MTNRLTEFRQRLYRYIIPFANKILYQKLLGTLMAFIFVYFMYFIILCYQCYQIMINAAENFQIHINEKLPNFVTFNGRFIDTKSPATFEIVDLEICFYMKGDKEHICKMIGNDFKIFRLGEIEVQQDFKIEPNKDFKLEKLKQLFTRGLSVKANFKIRLKYRILTFPLSFRHELSFDGKNSPIEVIQHQLKNGSLISKVHINFSFLQAKMNDINFDILLNEKIIGNLIIQLLNKSIDDNYLTLRSVLIFNKNNLEAMNAGLMEIIHKKKLILEFKNLKPNGYVENALFNVFRHHEVFSLQNKNKINKNAEPYINIHIEKIIFNAFIARLSIHRTLINNFIDSSLFFNKIHFPDLQLEMHTYQNKDKDDLHKLIDIDVSNIKDKESMVFKCTIKVHNLSLILLRPINLDSIFEISIKHDDFVGEICKGIALLWNYQDGFIIKSKDLATKYYLEKSQTVHKNINLFCVDSKISNKSVDKVCIENIINLPGCKDLNNLILFGWDTVYYQIKIKDFRVDGYIKEANVYLNCCFTHPSDIIKGTSLCLVSKLSRSNIKCVKPVNTTNTTFHKNYVSLYTSTIGFQAGENQLINGISANIDLNLLGNVNADSVSLDFAENIRFKLLRIKSFNEFDALICASPIKIEALNYIFDFNLQIPKLSLLFKNLGSKSDFLIVNIESCDINLSISNNTIYNISTITKDGGNILVNVYIDWKKFNSLHSADVSAQIEGMNVLNHVNIPPINMDTLRYSQMEMNALSCDIPKQPVFVKYNPNIDIKLSYKNDFLLNFDINIPKECISEQDHKQGTGIAWKKTMIILTDDKNKKSSVTLDAGELCFAIDKKHKATQKCYEFKTSFCHNPEFSFNIKTIEFNNNGERYIQKICRLDSYDFAVLFKKIASNAKTGNSSISDLIFTEKDRSVRKNNDQIIIRNCFSITISEQDTILCSIKSIFKVLSINNLTKDLCVSFDGDIILLMPFLKIQVCIYINLNIPINNSILGTKNIILESEIHIKTISTSKKHISELLSALATKTNYLKAVLGSYLSPQFEFSLNKNLVLLNNNDYIVLRQRNFEIGRLNLNAKRDEKDAPLFIFTNYNGDFFIPYEELSIFYVCNDEELLLLKIGGSSIISFIRHTLGFFYFIVVICIYHLCIILRMLVVYIRQYLYKLLCKLKIYL